MTDPHETMELVPAAAPLGPGALADRKAALARLEESKLLLHVCARPDEAKTIRDQAEAIRVWARAMRNQGEVERVAAEIRVRAERRVGELLPDDDYVAGPGRGHREKVRPGERPFSTKQASLFRALAAFPAERFEAALVELGKTARAVHSAGVLRLLRDVPPPGMSPEGHAFSQALAVVNQLVPLVVRTTNEVAVRPDVREEFRRLLPQVLALKNQFAVGFRKERKSS